MGHNGYQVFNPEGGFERLVKTSAQEGPMAMLALPGMEIRADPLGNALIAPGTHAASRIMARAYARLQGTPVEEEDAGVDERGLERLGLDGDVVSSTPVVQGWRVPREVNEEDLNPTDWAGVAAMEEALRDFRYFEPGFHWDVLPDGAIAYADSSTYTIRIFRDGVVLNTLTRPIAPQPVTDDIESMAREAMLDALGGELGVEVSEAAERQALAAMRVAFENMKFYPEVPVIAEIRTTPDGFVWVHRQDPVLDDNDGLIDVFDPEGSYVGTFPKGGLRMPAAFGPGGLVAFWETDDMDIPGIVVYRLPEKLRR